MSMTVQLGIHRARALRRWPLSLVPYPVSLLLHFVRLENQNNINERYFHLVCTYHVQVRVCLYTVDSICGWFPGGG